MNAKNTIELTEKHLSDLFKNSAWARDSVERVAFLELEEAVRELTYVRRNFCNKVAHVKSQLEEAHRLAQTPGREPNSCGSLQSSVELEVLNGRLNACRKMVAGFVTIAKTVGVLDKSAAYVF